MMQNFVFLYISDVLLCKTSLDIRPHLSLKSVFHIVRYIADF